MSEERTQYLPIEEMAFFKQFELLSDRVWDLVNKWPYLAIDTVGKQLIRAAIE